MEFKTTSTKRHGAAFTLAEFLVASGVGALFMLVTSSVFSFSNISLAALTNYADLENASRQALDIMSREIRQVRSLKTFETNKLTFLDLDGHDLVYAYDAGAQKLYRQKDGIAQTLLTQCTELNFSIFQRNTIGDTYDQFPTVSTGTCKLVQLNWVCRRSVLNNRVNTESVQSAKIVIRAK